MAVASLSTFVTPWRGEEEEEEKWGSGSMIGTSFTTSLSKVPGVDRDP